MYMPVHNAAPLDSLGTESMMRPMWSAVLNEVWPGPAFWTVLTVIGFGHPVFKRLVA